MQGTYTIYINKDQARLKVANVYIQALTYRPFVLQIGKILYEESSEYIERFVVQAPISDTILDKLIRLAQMLNTFIKFDVATKEDGQNFNWYGYTATLEGISASEGTKVFENGNVYYLHIPIRDKVKMSYAQQLKELQVYRYVHKKNNKNRNRNKQRPQKRRR